jgi:hypothetical protein
MTVNADPFTVATTRSRKLLLDITELIEAFNTELEISGVNLGITASDTLAPTPVTAARRHQQEGQDANSAADTVPPFTVGDRVRITNRVQPRGFPLPYYRQSLSADKVTSLNTGVIVRITTSRIHIKLDGQQGPSRVIQRHPSNVTLLA